MYEPHFNPSTIWVDIFVSLVMVWLSTSNYGDYRIIGSVCYRLWWDFLRIMPPRITLVRASVIQLKIITYPISFLGLDCVVYHKDYWFTAPDPTMFSYGFLLVKSKRNFLKIGTAVIFVLFNEVHHSMADHCFSTLFFFQNSYFMAKILSYSFEAIKVECGF